MDPDFLPRVATHLDLGMKCLDECEPSNWFSIHSFLNRQAIERRPETLHVSRKEKKESESSRFSEVDNATHNANRRKRQRESLLVRSPCSVDEAFSERLSSR